MTTWIGPELVDLVIDLRKMSSKGSTGKEIAGMVSRALASVGLTDTQRFYSSFLGAVIDGEEVRKMKEGPLLTKQLFGCEEKLRGCPVVWDFCHQLERIWKRLNESDPFVKALENRLAACQNIFAIGKGKYLLVEQCEKLDSKFLVAKKDVVTRWVAHKEKTYENHFKTLLPQVKVLRKSSEKKKKRKHLANELLNVVNVSLILVLKTVLEQLRKLSIYGQSRNKAP